MSKKLIHVQSICSVKIRGITAEGLARIVEAADEGVYTSVTIDRTGVVIECCNHPTAKGLIDDLIHEYNVDYHLEPGQAIDPKSRDIDEEDDEDLYDSRYSLCDDEEWERQGRQDAMMMRVFGTTRPMGSGAAGGGKKRK